jgi:hypothetical protein
VRGISVGVKRRWYGCLLSVVVVVVVVVVVKKP